MLMLHAVMHAHMALSAPINGPRVTNMLVVSYEVIYRWRHTHPFIESIKRVNITETHVQFLHFTFLIKMLNAHICTKIGHPLCPLYKIQVC